MNSSIRSYIFAIIATVLWGTTFAIGKIVVPNPLSPITFTCIRTVFGAGILILFILIRHEFHFFMEVFHRRFFILLAIGMILYSGAYVVQYWGLSYTYAIHQTIMANTQTFWVVVFNFLIFKRKSSRSFLLGAIISFIGVLFVIINENIEFSSATLRGDLISLVAFILWGGYTAFSKPISTQENPLYVTTGFILCAAILLVPLSFLLNGPAEMILLSYSQWGIMVYLGVFCVAITFILWNYALSNKNLDSENIAIINMAQPIVGIITSIIILGEILTVQAMIGFIIVLSGMIVANYHTIRPKSEVRTQEKNIEVINKELD